MSGTDLLPRLVEALAGAPADEVELSGARTERGTTRFAGSSIHQNVAERSHVVTARAVVGGRIGAATSNDLSRDGLRRLVTEAARFAGGSPVVPGFRGLPDPSPPSSPPPESSFEGEGFDPGGKGERLREIFRLAEREGAELHGSWTGSRGEEAIANSRGLAVRQELSFGSATFIALRGEGSGFSCQAGGSEAGLPIEALAHEALDRARLASAPRRELPPGEYDVVLEPAAVSEILEWLGFIAFSSRSWEDGSSCLIERIGERVTGARFTLRDDATDPSGIPSRFDGEGTRKRPLVLVENGVARACTFDKLSADRLGLEPTGHALGARVEEGSMPTNLFVDPGSTPREELVGGLERGIWISRFHYLNGLLDPRRAMMTGMTRDGALLVEKGRVVAPIVDLRWTDSILEAFGRIDALSPDRRPIAPSWGGASANVVPAIRIRGFRFTGVSKG
jgi:predicted Zn-dependent protease